MKIVPVPCRSDNYMYLLIDEPTKTAAAVDPYDVAKLEAAAAQEGVKVVSVLTTHHHDDHAAGNPTFASKYADAPIYGGSKQVAAVTHIVKDGDELTLGETVRLRCLATPCHTQDSICYHATAPAAGHPGAVFTGDTLFIGGCGRFFEGTGPEMHAALTYLSTLPNPTVVYNGHEYTKGNVAFAKKIDPDNAAVQQLESLANANAVTCGLTTIGQEKEWNVFMRLDSAPVLNATGLKAGDDTGAVMDELRNQKNKS